MLLVSSKYLTFHEYESAVGSYRGTVNSKVVEKDTFRYCSGCLNCWVKTPGRCVMNDDFVEFLDAYIREDAVVFISDIEFGSIAPQIKNCIDRMIPLYMPYIRLGPNGLNHIKRYDHYPSISVCLLGKTDSRSKSLIEGHLKTIFGQFGCVFSGFRTID